MTDQPTVLVVEDEVDLATLYANWLDDEYDVHVAYSAEDALEEVDDTVDVVLLDRRLPDMSGDAFLDSIRDAGYDCQVAMVSAVDPDWDILEMRFDAYVVKPVERSDLKDLVGRLLARRLYNDEVKRFFSLASKRATLESTKERRELEASDRYADLLDEIEMLHDSLDDIVHELTDEDFIAVLTELQETVEETDTG
jgi:DNA-binding response OmpR family regulator